MGRPAKGERVQLSVRIPEELHRLLCAYAAGRMLSIGEVVEAAIRVCCASPASAAPQQALRVTSVAGPPSGPRMRSLAEIEASKRENANLYHRVVKPEGKRR